MRAGAKVAESTWRALSSAKKGQPPMPDPFAFEGLLDHPEQPRSSAALPVLLMIEDDPMFGRFANHAAEECGYQFARASDIQSFVGKFHHMQPDMIGVDLHVPGCDGIEVLRFLAGERYDGRVLICSGLDRRVLESAYRFGEALGLNMAAPLAKPFRFEELAQRLMDPVSDPC
jgi:CheY-like chemotaxis protein